MGGKRWKDPHTVTSAKPIDERMIRYIDRSSVFEEPGGGEIQRRLKLVMSDG
jgi:hypothetical protein